MKKLVLVLLLLAVLLPAQAEAQEETVATRFYFIPEEDAAGIEGKGPKYLKWRFDPDPPGIDCPYVYMHYGAIHAGLVAAEVTPEQHTELTSYSDVTAAPLDIDQNVSAAALPQVRQALEDLRIPADWVTTDYTYRDILRRVGGLFQFAQRHRGLHGEELITSTAQLDLTWSQVPAAKRERVMETADSFGYDYSTVTGTWTVRRTLMHLANQWGDQPFYFQIDDWSTTL